MAIDEQRLNELRGRVTGPVFTPEDEGYAAEIACFNLAITHTPDLVIGVESADDVVEAIGFAKSNDLKVSIQSAGHTESVITFGLIISTKRLDGVEVDAEAATARIGAGVIWKEVVAAASPHGLAPIAGSSVDVSVVGYLTGGGLGPLVRSHGFSSDYLLEATVVTGTGEVLKSTGDENSDLFWAVRGGKYGFGVITEVVIKLDRLDSIYGGSVFIAEENIEAAFRGWIDWTASADERVSTSAAIIQFPPFEEVPEPLRGRRMLSIRFAYPDGNERGEELAAPIRALATPHLDMIDELPMAQIAMVHNDPAEPGESWVSGAMLSRADGELAGRLLSAVGAGTDTPLISVELRHLGGAAAIDVDGGSSVGGRDAGFVFDVVAVDPTQFASGAPEAFAELVDAIGPWLSSENNINFLGRADSQARLDSAWPVEIRSKLKDIRATVDPDGIFATPPI